jgi:hypothetical protein
MSDAETDAEGDIDQDVTVAEEASDNEYTPKSTRTRKPTSSKVISHPTEPIRLEKVETRGPFIHIVPTASNRKIWAGSDYDGDVENGVVVVKMDREQDQGWKRRSISPVSCTECRRRKQKVLLIHKAHWRMDC